MSLGLIICTIRRAYDVGNEARGDGDGFEREGERDSRKDLRESSRQTD